MSLTSPDRGWLLEHIDYNSGALEGLYRALISIVDHAGDARVVLRNIDGGLEGRGAAIADVQTDAGDIAGDVGRTVATLGRIAEVVRGYGEAVSAHARAANDLVDDIERAHRAVADAEGTAAEAASRQTGLADDATPAEVSRADGAVESAAEDLAARRRELADLWAQWEASYALWDDAYGSALAALVAADVSSLPAHVRSAIEALAHADSPAEVAEIWASLTEDQRTDLVDRRAEFVGNLEGVPYAIRFAANRSAFERVLDGGPYGKPLDDQLEQLSLELGDDLGGQLLMFHPFEEPQATAAVVYGASSGDDPFAGVTNVNALVGGMFSGLGDLEAWGQSARDLNVFAEAYGDPGTRSVSIAWYGYDSPNLLTEHTMGSATEGAARLSSTLRGLDNEVSSAVTTSVIGHSYGSTTSFLAVGGAGDDLGVDRLVAVGSAGVPDGYHANWTGDAPMDYSGTEVFTSRAPWDFVARYGEVSSFGHGMNPEDIPGATTFESNGGTAPSLQGTPEDVAGTPGHAAHDGGNSIIGWWEKGNGYLSRDSESFRNIANIVANGEVLQ
jgi:hypothetical protein